MAYQYEQRYADGPAAELLDNLRRIFDFSGLKRLFRTKTVTRTSSTSHASVNPPVTTKLKDVVTIEEEAVRRIWAWIDIQRCALTFPYSRLSTVCDEPNLATMEIFIHKKRKYLAIPHIGLTMKITSLDGNTRHISLDWSREKFQMKFLSVILEHNKTYELSEEAITLRLSSRKHIEDSIGKLFEIAEDKKYFFAYYDDPKYINCRGMTKLHLNHLCAMDIAKTQHLACNALLGGVNEAKQNDLTAGVFAAGATVLLTIALAKGSKRIIPYLPGAQRVSRLLGVNVGSALNDVRKKNSTTSELSKNRRVGGKTGTSWSASWSVFNFGASPLTACMLFSPGLIFLIVMVSFWYARF